MTVRKVRLFPAPHVEIKVYVTEQMQQDFKECKEISRKTQFEKAKDCDSCSWRDVEIEGTGLCEFKILEQILEDEK